MQCLHTLYFIASQALNARHDLYKWALTARSLVVTKMSMLCSAPLHSADKSDSESPDASSSDESSPFSRRRREGLLHGSGQEAALRGPGGREDVLHGSGQEAALRGPGGRSA